jgi:hypothetical protein
MACMTVKLNLASDTQSRLEARAKAAGLPLEEYLQRLIEGMAAGSDAEQERLALAGEAAAGQVLAPEDFSDWK